MAIKQDLLGMLIYAATALDLAAAAAFALRRRGTGAILFAGGFLACAAAIALRWRQVGHVPLQSLLEVFLCLAALIPILSAFWGKFLGAKDYGIDALLAAILLLPTGLVFPTDPRPLPPILQHVLFVPHVAAYLLADVILLKAALTAARRLFAGARTDLQRLAELEQVTGRLVRLGFPLLTAGLLLGAWWGKLAWGDYWNWDPKELWSLATWLIFAAYLHYRPWLGGEHPRAASAIAVAGGVAAALTLVWVNLSRVFAGLHTYAT